MGKNPYICLTFYSLMVLCHTFCFFFLGHWVSTAFGETHGSINVKMMAKFRNGSYDSQDECTKAAWLFFATKLMAAVNPTCK
jgi:hypothetical protein